MRAWGWACAARARKTRAGCRSAEDRQGAQAAGEDRVQGGVAEVAGPVNLDSGSVYTIGSDVRCGAERISRQFGGGLGRDQRIIDPVSCDLRAEERVMASGMSPWRLVDLRSPTRPIRRVRSKLGRRSSSLRQRNRMNRGRLASKRSTLGQLPPPLSLRCPPSSCDCWSR
jgi:hypothetical protein